MKKTYNVDWVRSTGAKLLRLALSKVEREQQQQVDPTYEAASPAAYSRDHVVWAYRLLLDREPENEAVVNEKLGVGDLRRMVYDMISSDEFRGRRLSDATKDLRGEWNQPKYVMTEMEDGNRFWVNLRDNFVSRSILLGGWETTETNLVKSYLQPGMRALDIGANLGWFTVHMARLVGASGTVVAFEPRADIYRNLEKTIAANGLSNVTAHNLALGPANGEMMLEWNSGDENPGGTHLSARLGGTNIVGQNNDILTQRTKVRRLDELVDDKVDFIKIDVEGAEKIVFDGARRVLAESRPVILSELSPAALLEVSGIAVNDHLQYIADLGYAAHEIGPDRKVAGLLQTWPYGADRELISVLLVPLDRPDLISTLR